MSGCVLGTFVVLQKEPLISKAKKEIFLVFVVEKKNLQYVETFSHVTGKDKQINNKKQYFEFQ